MQNRDGIPKKNDHDRPFEHFKPPPCRPPQPLTLPPPTPPPPTHLQGNVMVTGMTVMASMICAALLLGILCALVRLYFNRRNHSRRSLPIFFATQDDFLDEDRGPHLDNPIWYINFVGLQQSVIDSITVFKYKKDEGLIEGTAKSLLTSTNGEEKRNFQNRDGIPKKNDHDRPFEHFKPPPCRPPQPLTLPPPTPPPPTHLQGNVMVTGMTVMASMICAALLLGILCALVRLYFNRRNHSRRSLPIFFATQDDFLDEDRGPHLDNPIWYINFVGLQQSVIDSITVFKYKKDEGLIEGTECSVCLNEFQEDESLRLLPKCSHAFHLPCIDTWLRSHKNCPLCRAPVVCETMVAQASASEPNSIDSGSRNETLVENSENFGGGIGRNDVGESGTCPIEDGNTSENSKKSLVHSTTRSSDSVSQVLSDLAGVQDDVQPTRRSVSLDLSSALEIYSDVAGHRIGAHKHRGSLDTELQQLKYPKGKIVAKRGSEISSICKLMKSSSIGRSLSKGPISMKRSFSSGGKFLLSKQSRIQDSILPL